MGTASDTYESPSTGQGSNRGPDESTRKKRNAWTSSSRTVRDAGISPWATLHHTLLPGWFADDTDGFRRTGGPSIHWSRHVDRTAELLDGIVAGWIPNEDPIGWAIRSHHLGTRPGSIDPETLQDALEGSLEATFGAWRLLSSGDAPVVSSFAIPPIHRMADEAADQARTWNDVIWKSWTEAIRDGVLRWPWKAPHERPDLADAFDAIGLVATSPIGVEPDGSFVPWPTGAQVDGSGLAPNPEHFGIALRHAADLLPERELIITSLGVGTDEDSWRDDLMGGWLDQIHDATTDGIPIRGVFFDSFVDGYDPDTGFDSPRGLFTRGREPKPSTRWLQA